jgi:malate dehydrogenase
VKISVVGAAGWVGSCTAFDVAVHKLADEIIMIDPGRRDALRQHVSDLSTAVAGLGVIVRLGSFDDLPGSDIVINAAGVSPTLSPGDYGAQPLGLLEANLDLMRHIGSRIAEGCPDGIVITVTNPVDPLNYAQYLLSSSRDRSRFIGYSTNDTFRFRIMVAEALKVNPGRVDCIVIGEHGETQVMLFSSIRVDGESISVDEEFKRNIKGNIPGIFKVLEELRDKTGRTAAWTSAVGVREMVNAIRKDSKAVIPCNAVLDGEYGTRSLSTTVPAVIGKNGIERIKVLELPEDEAEGFNRTINHLAPRMRLVEERLGIK